MFSFSARKQLDSAQKRLAKWAIGVKIVLKLVAVNAYPMTITIGFVPTWMADVQKVASIPILARLARRHVACVAKNNFVQNSKPSAI